MHQNQNHVVHQHAQMVAGLYTYFNLPIASQSIDYQFPYSQIMVQIILQPLEQPAS
jgi:hypothetical protein